MRSDYSTVFRSLQSVRRYDRPLSTIETAPTPTSYRVIGWGCAIGLVVLAVLMAAGVVR